MGGLALLFSLLLSGAFVTKGWFRAEASRLAELVPESSFWEAFLSKTVENRLTIWEHSKEVNVWECGSLRVQIQGEKAPVADRNPFKKKKKESVVKADPEVDVWSLIFCFWIVSSYFLIIKCEGKMVIQTIQETEEETSA